MNQLAAMRETLTLAQRSGMADISGFAEGCDYWHLQDMMERAQSGEFSEAKLGRWLGWMQCAVVAAGIGPTLDDMKQINLSYADPRCTCIGRIDLFCVLHGLESPEPQRAAEKEETTL